MPDDDILIAELARHIAPSDHKIKDVIAARWSPRAFSERPVPSENLLSLLEAARWAASCANEQPWRYIVTTKDDQEVFARLLSCLTDSNAMWAQRAPVLMISVARISFESSGEANRHALHDVGQASANMAIEAVALGLEIHQMAGFSVTKARDSFSIPEGFEPVAVIAVGYTDEPAILPDKLRDRELAPRNRRKLEEFAFGEKWGEAAAALRK